MIETSDNLERISKNDKMTFVIPHFAENKSEHELLFLQEMVDGLFAQTDSQWQAIIIDDYSSNKSTKTYLEELKRKYYSQIDVIFLDKNLGPGACRNIGISWAHKRCSKITVFNDADDISHPSRIEHLREIYDSNPDIDLIYTYFHVIDENKSIVEKSKISNPITEILEFLALNPLEGKEVWEKMGTITGYINKTSATAVKTYFAYKCPFPNERASEDFHAWLRIAAQGANFKFTREIPSFYRIPSYLPYQTSRSRIGKNNFNKIKMSVDIDGFYKAIEIASSRNTIAPHEIPDLKAKFLKRLAATMQREGENTLVKELLYEASQYESLSSYYK